MLENERLESCWTVADYILLPPPEQRAETKMASFEITVPGADLNPTRGTPAGWARSHPSPKLNVASVNPCMEQSKLDLTDLLKALQSSKSAYTLASLDRNSFG